MKRALLLFLSAFGYNMLAVAGWGGFKAYFAHTPLIGLTAALGAIAIASLFAGGSISPGVREDRSNRWVLVPFSVFGLLLGWLPAFTDRHDFWSLDGGPMRWTGVVVFLIGGALRLWPVFVLGFRFSGLVAIQPGHTLVTNGPYRIVRHPSYLGMLIYGPVGASRFARRRAFYWTR